MFLISDLMKSGISPVVGTVLLIAIAVIGAVAVWYWSSAYVGKPVLPQVTFSSYTVVSVYKNATGDGCSSLDIRNTGGDTLNISGMYIREITSGRSAGMNGTSPDYVAYINMSALTKGQVGNFPILGTKTIMNFLGTVIDYSPGVGPIFAVGDADNDGLNEIIFGAGASDSELSMYKNVSGGWVRTVIKTPLQTESIEIGDANNDGKNEIVAGGMNSGNYPIRIFKNTSLSNVTANWQETNITYLFGNRSYSVAIGNADNVAGNEIVAGIYQYGSSPNRTIRMYKNITAATWSETNISLINVTVYAVRIGNVDGSGNSVVAGYGAGISGGGSTMVYKNVSGGWNVTDLSSLCTDEVDVSIGDANNDGGSEIVLSASGSCDGLYVINKTGGSWAILATLYSGISTFNRIGDPNNNGRNEIINLNWEAHGGGALVLYENKTGTWVSSDITPGGAYAYDPVAIGDVNNDASIEIVASVSGGIKIYNVINVPDIISASLPRGTYILRASGQGYSDQRFTCV